MSSVGSEEGGEVRHGVKHDVSDWDDLGDCGRLVVRVAGSRSGVLIQSLVRQGCYW